ncbi:MAG: flagellar export chaperone FliS [Gammaproteobacteria bacterium]|nr:flagellar export chaperone FliS [Gammaproteobacteria bacterium]
MQQPRTQRAAANLYSRMGVQGGVETANPHRLVLMLMQGAIDRLAMAKGAMKNRDISTKGQMISKVMTIIGGLRGSLDMDLEAGRGGEISANLYSLYDYMERRLLDANVKNDVVLLDEVSELMVAIKSAWENIA